MIPVSLPGGNFYVTMGLSLVCLATLLTWGASLARSRDARYWLADHRRLGGTLLALLAIVGGIFPYQQFSHWFEAQRVARAEAARRQVLDHSQQLAGVTMPAGTELVLRTPGQPDSFEEARFSQATEVGGAKVLRIVRHLDADGQSKEWSMALAANEPVDGWICGKGHLAEFRLEQGKPRLDSCHLASGNTLDQQALPAGTWLKATPEGWLLRTDGSDALRLDGLDLLKTDVKLSPARQRLAFEGLLAQESARGEVTYPAGTRVATPGAKVSNAQAGDLLFSPSRGRSARRAGGEEVAAGKSILQAADGSVRSVLSNRDAGVLDVASVRLGR